MNFNQCLLVNENDGRATVSWIPSKFAEVARKVRMKFTEWEDGWVVMEVGTQKTQEELTMLNAAYRHQREVSDV
jgi:hypothetical protein